MEFLYALILKIKENYYFILIFILLIVINDAIILSDFYSLKNSEVKISENTKLNETVKDDTKDLFVDIKGEVKKEGVYKVTSGMTVNDVIKLAGGLKKSAFTKNINLSKRVFDEMVIIVYSKSSLNNNVNNNKNDALIKNEEKALISSSNSSSNLSLVNINTASIDELLTLSGIGNSKAEAIIKYRESNKFNTIDDIKNISGIGDSLFEKIKDYISV